MAASGLEVFDKTLQTTNIWLDEIMDAIGSDRKTAWHALGAVLQALRDRLPLELAVHFGAQLPLLIRGAYYAQWDTSAPGGRSSDSFLDHVADGLKGTGILDPTEAVVGVFAAVTRHVDAGQVRKVMDALPRNIRQLWPEEAGVR